MHSPSSHPSAFPDDRRGIALMVVMVVFVILYLVVYHLQYGTSMEKKIAQVRQGESASLDAQFSASQYAMVLLLEDYKQDLTESQEKGSSSGAALTSGLQGAQGGARQSQDLSGFLPIQVPGMSGAAAQGGGGGGEGSEPIDYILENLLHPTTQTYGDTEVKVQLVNNEACIDLNRLFEYARAQLAQASGTGLAGLSDVSEEDLVGDVVGAGSEQEAASNLRSRILSRTALGGTNSRTGRGTGEAAGQDGSGALSASEELAQAGLAVPGLEDEKELAEFQVPAEQEILATRQMLERAIHTLFSINEDRGFFYEEPHSAADIAAEIVDYVLTRRQAPVQNIIYHQSELLNLYTVTSELYYGPQPAIAMGEELDLGTGFLLRRDEFGDLTAEYLYTHPDLLLQKEDEQLLLEELKERFAGLGSFLDFPLPGISSLNANALTRGMSEPTVDYDETTGEEYVVEPPLPIGLKDIFTAFSSGKININTASVPVLYGLLPSLSEGVEGEANFVAVMINDYRHRFQEFVEGEEEGVERVATTPDLGQPRRTLPTEEELAADEDLYGLDDYDLMSMQGQVSTYADLETNYFTNLRQLELIDGVDGGPDDRLNSDTQVERVSVEQGPLLQRAINDYTPLAVFGGTYFTVELKARTKESPVIKTSYLVLKRDTQNRRIEVVLWKELQK
ncbi:MAG: hypothetical protein JXA90_01910 [Planctomycetes bacterium]|nr:hypothetical protein [Planctomycetota bacterium]